MKALLPPSRAFAFQRVMLARNCSRIASDQTVPVPIANTFRDGWAILIRTFGPPTRMLAMSQPKAPLTWRLRMTTTEDIMVTGTASTFLLCAGLFVLCFVAIGAFWFVERLRGDSAPNMSRLTGHLRS